MREVRASDFGERARIRMYFPRKGSQVTPPHYSVDFYWKDYCPMVFRCLSILCCYLHLGMGLCLSILCLWSLKIWSCLLNYYEALTLEFANMNYGPAMVLGNLNDFQYIFSKVAHPGIICREEREIREIWREWKKLG